MDGAVGRSGGIYPVGDERVAESEPVPLTVELVRSLMDTAQSGGAGQVSERCGTWLRSLSGPDELSRFWLLAVQFVCAQAEGTDLDEREIVEQLVSAADRSFVPAAMAAARSCRALLLATRGRYAMATADLSRATVLLESESAFEPVPPDLGGPHLRRWACNTLALALMRQSINDHAVHWLEEFRRAAAPLPDGVAATFQADFNEAWIHLTTAIDLDLDPDTSEDDARSRYRSAAHCFERVVVRDGSATSPSPLIGSARRIGAASSMLAGDLAPAGWLRAEVAGPEHQRPDHRAIYQLAMARADTDAGDPGAAMARLDTALEELPADHSFRSIASRLRWEKVVVSRRVVGEPVDDPAVSMLRFLLRDRRQERLTRGAAYAEALEGERQRLSLMADRERAQVDPLTRLATRQVLGDALDLALEEVQQADRRAVLVFVDLDDFKNINDTRSHQSGDLTLELFGTEVRRMLLDGDLAVRYGGDEFVLILRNRTVDEARGELDDLRARFGAVTAAHREIAVPVTFSAGIIDITAGGSPDELLRETDLSMLTGKRSGRDAIVTGSVRRGRA